MSMCSRPRKSEHGLAVSLTGTLAYNDMCKHFLGTRLQGKLERYKDTRGFEQHVEDCETQS